MKKLTIILLSVISFISCEKKPQSIEKKLQPVIAKKSQIVSVAIEDVITTLTLENRTLLINELEKPHKHNDFVTIETVNKKSPITIIFENIQGKSVYTGTQTIYNKNNEKKDYIFTTLTAFQLKKLKETFESGWKD